MNEVLKIIADRYACRSFTDEKPTDDQLQEIANAAIAAPSAMNLQRWRVIVVKDKALIDEMDAEGLKNLAKYEQGGYERIMSRGGKLLYNAPSMIMIPVDRTDETEKNMEWVNIDCGVVGENVALAAASLGLGNVICLMCGFAFMGEKAEEFKKRLKFPEGYGFGMCVLIGHATAPTAPHTPDKEKIIVISS